MAKGPGFVIPIVIAAFFGAGSLTDAYFLAYGGVLLVGGAVAQPLEAVVVPFAAHALALGHRASAAFSRELARRGGAIGLASVAVGAILIVFGMAISRPDVSRGQVLGFYAILAPGAIAWCVASLYSGSLISAWRLELVALAYGFRGLGALVGALVGSAIHEMWPVALGVSTGEWIRVWWVRSLWKRAIRALPAGADGSPQRGLVTAAAHQMGAQGLVAAVQFLERFVAGTVAVAAITHVEYSMRLVMVASVLFDGGVAPWLLARWANAHVAAKLRSDWANVYRPVLMAALAAAGIGCLLFFGAPIMVKVVLYHGAFSSADARAVTQLLRWYAPAYSLNMVALCLERLLLARAQNQLFLRLAGLRAGIRIGVMLALLSSMNVLALPIAFAASEAGYVILLALVSRREEVRRDALAT